MRIGMFVDMYKPYLSGVTNYVSLYKQRFEALGHDVFVFTFGDRDHPDDEPNVVRSPGLHFVGTAWQLGLTFSPEARKIIRTLDIAHVHHPFQSGRLVLKHCASEGIPVVFTSHSRYDIYSDEYVGYVPKAMRYAYIRWYLDKFCRDCDLVIVPSPGIQEWMAGFGVTASTKLLSNAVDTLPFRRPASPMDKTDLGFPADSVVICYLGRVSHEKNVRTLLDAFVQASKSDERLRLLLIGDGTATEDAQAILSDQGLLDNAHLAGRVPYELVPDYCAAADVFATASVSEVHPLVIMEAMAAGMPALGVDSPGVSDIIEDGVTGFIVENGPNVVGDLADRMVRLTQEAELRETLADSAVEQATDRYDIRKTAERMLQHYERLVASRDRTLEVSVGMTE